MNNSIEYSGLYWKNNFVNEYSGFCFNWILNWIIFRPDSMKKWIFKTDRPGLLPCPKENICCCGEFFPFYIGSRSDNFVCIKVELAKVLIRKILQKIWWRIDPNSLMSSSSNQCMKLFSLNLQILKLFFYCKGCP